MDDERLLLSLAEGRISKCKSQYTVTSTNFLDVNQQSVILSKFSREPDVKTVLYGGFDEAERNIAVFVPDFLNISSFEELQNYFNDNPEDNPLTLLRIKKDNFSNIGHRDYLGALMGLGIKRETIGDIVITKTGADLVCLKQMASFIKNELTSAGRATLNVEEAPFSDIENNISSAREENVSVTSMRLDNIISACFKLSRNGASEAVNSGLVFVNSVQATKCDKKVNFGDKIVFRSKGKIILKEQSGLSKKGRIFMKIDFFG